MPILAFLFLLLSSHSVYAVDVVKLSRNGICHDSNSQNYARTTNFTAYASMAKCVEKGGRPYSGYQEGASKKAIATNDYDRDDYPHWSDFNNDCQNTRAEILIEKSQKTVGFTNNKQCVVRSGQWFGPYTNKIYTQAKDLDIDHVVPLAWAHARGAKHWKRARKEEFANDWHNLLIVEKGQNRQKGAKGPDEWLPMNHAYRCEYIVLFDSIVKKYGLQYQAREKRVIDKQLAACRG